MIKDEYSPYKVVHHLDKIEQLKRGEQIDPVQIHLIPTNRCNQNCTFCAYRMPEYPSSQTFDPRHEIPEAKLLEIIDSCARMGVKGIQYTGGGEPLVHPAIGKAFELTLGHGLDLALVSNGLALNDELIALLADAAWVRVSMDSFRRGTYSLIRRVKASCYDTVTANIAKLAKVKRRAILGIGFVVNAENFGEIYDACKYFKELGVDNFRISAAFTPMGIDYFSGFLTEAKELAQRAKEDFQDEGYTVFNLFNDRIGDLFHGVQDYPYCPMKEFVPYLGADQNLYTCCMLAYNDKGLIGSLSDKTLEELWRGPDKRDFFGRHDPRQLCRMPCMFQGKNEFINYCIKKDPRHINFI